MEEKPEKPDVGFQEALRRIANTPKNVVEKVVNAEKRPYNGEKEAEKTPPRG